MRISKRAAIRTYHPNFVYCLETVTVRGVFELLYLGGLCPTPFSVYRYIYTSTAYRSIRILFVRWMFARSETWNNLRQINNITRIYINLYKNVEEWVKLESNFIIVSKLYLSITYIWIFLNFLYINNRCRLDLHGRHFVQRERHKMEDSRFSTSPGSFSCFLWSKLMMMIQIRETLLYGGNASRGIRCLSRYIRITVCPWRVVHSSGNQAVKQRLRCHRVCYNHAYVFTLVRRERYFCPFRFRVFWYIYISLHFRYGYSQLSILDEKFIKEKELINHINVRSSENLLLFFKCIATTTTTKNNYL